MLQKQLEAVPPHDPQAERRLVGALIAKAQEGYLRPEDVSQEVLDAIYMPDSRAVYSAILNLVKTGVLRFDEVTLRNNCELPEQEFETYVSSRDVLESVLALAPDYASIVICRAQDRKRYQIASDLLSGSPLPAIRSEMASLEETQETDAIPALRQNLNDIYAGIRVSVRWPGWNALSSIQALLPGTVTLICGSPGASKSFFVLEAIWRWSLQNTRACVLELEATAADHLFRAFAQITGRSEMLTLEWTKTHPQEVERLWAAHQGSLAKAAAAIYTPPQRAKADCDWLLQWLQARCSDGYRIIAIDPITMMQGSSQRFLDHEIFVYHAKQIVTKAGASLICVTHPRDGERGKDPPASLVSIPGSKAWQRFTDTILWLNRHGAEEALFTGPLGPVALRFNRTIIPLKTRHGVDPGKIRYYLDGATLCHKEQGIIQDDE